MPVTLADTQCLCVRPYAPVKGEHPQGREYSDEEHSCCEVECIERTHRFYGEYTARSPENILGNLHEHPGSCSFCEHASQSLTVSRPEHSLPLGADQGALDFEEHQDRAGDCLGIVYLSDDVARP